MSRPCDVSTCWRTDTQLVWVRPPAWRVAEQRALCPAHADEARAEGITVASPASVAVVACRTPPVKEEQIVIPVSDAYPIVEATPDKPTKRYRRSSIGRWLFGREWPL